MFAITKEYELHHSIGSLMDGAHPGPKTDRDYAMIMLLGTSSNIINVTVVITCINISC